MDSPSSMDTLPNELLTDIFRLLHHDLTPGSHRALKPFLLVNWKWHNLAAPILFKSLRLYVESTGAKLAIGTVSNICPKPFEYIESPRFFDKEWDDKKASQDLVESILPPETVAYEYCEYLRIDVMTSSSGRELEKMLTGCNNLRHIDVIIFFTETPTTALLSTLQRIQLSLDKMNLETFRLRVKTCLKGETENFMDMLIDPEKEFSSTFLNPIAASVTHLSIDQRDDDCNYGHYDRSSGRVKYFENLNLERFKRLKSFAFQWRAYDEYNRYGMQPIWYNSDQATFWKALQNTQIQELVLSRSVPRVHWSGSFLDFDINAKVTFAVLPSTLTKIDMTTDVFYWKKYFNPMSILTQLEHLETLIIRNVRQGGGYIENSQENVTGFIYDQSVTGKEIIKCKALHTFRLEHTGPIDLMPMIVKQCPLLKDVHLPIYSTDTDLLMLASKCQHLTRVGFKIIGMSDEGLGHLCDAKNLCEIHMLTESLDFVSRVNVFERWARELPGLKAVVVRPCQHLGSEEDQAVEGGTKFESEDEECDRKEWLNGFVKRDVCTSEKYFDMVAMRKDLVAGG